MQIQVNNLNQNFKDQFLMAVNDWVYDSCTIDIRYIARKSKEEVNLFSAVVYVAPFTPFECTTFNIETNEIIAGRTILKDLKKADALKVVEKSTNGLLEVNGKMFSLKSDREYDYYSELMNREQWFSNLNLRISAYQSNANQFSYNARPGSD